MNPNETQGPGQPGRNETPLNAAQPQPAASQYTAPQPQMPQPQMPQPQQPQRPIPQQPQPQPQRPQAPQAGQPHPGAANGGDVDLAQKANRFADQLGNQHVKVGSMTIAYATVVTIVGALLAVIGVFLPFISVNFFGSTMSVSMMHGADGWILLIGAVVIGVLALLRQEVAALTVTVIYTLLVIFEIASAASRLNTGGPYTQYVGVHYGAGMWLLVIAVIVMLIGTIVAFYNKQRAAKAAQTAPAPYGVPQQAGDRFQNNGWQFGVPPQQQPTTTDDSNWQFGVPNQTAAPAPAAPSVQTPAAVRQEPFAAPTGAPAPHAAPAAPYAPTYTPQAPAAPAPVPPSQPTAADYQAAPADGSDAPKAQDAQ